MSDAAAIIEDCQRRLDRARKGGGSWFRGGDGSLNHGTFHAQLAPYHDRVFYEGKVTWGALVMAQPVLFSRGGPDSTGTCVYSFDRQFIVDPTALVRIGGLVGALKKTMPKDPILIAFAAEVRNDEAREIDRMVPPSLTQGRNVRYETVYLQRNRMPTGYLAHTLFPIIISQSQPTQPMLLPLDFWAPELIEQWHELAQRNPPAEAPPAPTTTALGRYGGNKPGYDPYVDDNAGSGVSSYGYRDGDNPGRFGTPSATVTRDASGYGQAPTPPHAQGYGQAQPQPAPQAARGYDHAYGQPQGHGHAHGHAQGGASAEEAFANNPLRFTSTAAAVLKLMLRQQGFANGKVRVSVSGRGCQIDFTDEEPNPQQDFMYACDGVTILVDRDSASVLTGVQMDLPPSPQSMGFVFSRVA